MTLSIPDLFIVAVFVSALLSGTAFACCLRTPVVYCWYHDEYTWVMVVIGVALIGAHIALLCNANLLPWAALAGGFMATAGIGGPIIIGEQRKRRDNTANNEAATNERRAAAAAAAEKARGL